jgi:hypothetical protein
MGMRRHVRPGRFAAMTAAGAVCAAALVVVGAAGCGSGSFDQRERGEIDRLRGESFNGINSNPFSGPQVVRGIAWSGGPVSDARIVFHPVDTLGAVNWADDAALGNGITPSVEGEFRVTVSKPHTGALVVSLLPFMNSGQPARYTDPAHGKSDGRPEFGEGDELLGYVLDFPNSRTAVVVSPFTTLTVERAIHMGGASSGNLSVAARQVGAFFGMFEARRTPGNNLLQSEFSNKNRQAEDMAIAVVSQVAADAGVTQGQLWAGMRLDVRDDGELNGSSGFVPGSAVPEPDFTQAGFLGRTLEDPFLLQTNPQNESVYTVLNAPPGSSIRAQIDLLDTARLFADTSVTLTDASIENDTYAIAAGATRSLGLRGFEKIGDQYHLVVSSDGPTVANLTVTSANPAVCGLTADGRLSVPAGVAAGSETEITVRLRADGAFVTGPYDRTFVITVRAK